MKDQLPPRKRLQVPPRQELDLWLKAREERFKLRPETEKKIRWYQDQDLDSQVPLALVYVHGYSGTRRDISPSVELLADRLHAPVFFTRLTGHGLYQDPHRGVKLSAWEQDLEEALAIGHQLGNKVLLIGTSAGATLALWSILKGHKAEALILTSPLLAAVQTCSFLLEIPFLRSVVKTFMGPWMSFPPQNALQAEIWDYRHRTDSLLPLLTLARKVRHTSPAQIESPVLAFISPQDKVVSAPTALQYLSQIPPAKRKFVELLPSHDKDQHVLTGEALSPDTTNLWVDTVVNFLRQRNLLPLS